MKLRDLFWSKARQTQGAASESTHDGASTYPCEQEKAAGLHILYNPYERYQADDTGSQIIDLVAVHGLGGDAFKSWTHENNCIWLQDLLYLDFPNFRTSTFGYDSQVIFSKSVAGVNEFARQLLVALVALQEGTANRIILMCHSMGGIVVKKALAIANAEREQYGSLLEDVGLVVFLGTPHTGSNIAEFAKRIGHLSNAAVQSMGLPFWGRTRTDLLRLLERNSSELGNITSEFRIPARHLKIISAYETSKDDVIGSVIVTKESALLGYTEEDPLPLRGNHGEISRFGSRSSADYKDLVTSLKGWVAPLGRKQPSPIVDDHKASSLLSLTASDNEYLNTLSVNNYDYAKFIDALHAGTCSWILTDTRYMEWYSGSSQVLWITGYAGMGKSTLLAYLTNHLDQSHEKRRKAARSERPAVYSVFCDALDTDRRNVAQVVKNLLAQMAHKNQDILRTIKKLLNRIKQQFEYSFSAVSKAFKAALGLVREERVYIVVDGLDLLEQDTKRVLGDLQGLADSTSFGDGNEKQVRLLVSSKPSLQLTYQAHSDEHEFSLRVRLESMPTGLVNDIRRLIDTTFNNMVAEGRLSPQDAAEASQLVHNKAQGSFLWTSVVLREIEGSMWPTKAKLMSVISRMPASLDQVYTRHLPLPEEESLQTFRRVLHFLVAAVRPLTITELSVLVQTLEHADESDLAAVRPTKISIARMFGSLLYEDSERVCFSHQSVREFFLKVGQDSKHPLHESHGVILADAHRDLAEACVAYLGRDVFDLDLESPIDQPLTQSEDSPEVSSPTSYNPHDDSTSDMDIEDVAFLRDPDALRDDAIAYLASTNHALAYVTLNWHNHVLECEATAASSIIKAVLDLRSKRNFVTAWTCFSKSSRVGTPSLSQISHPLVFCSFFGFHAYLYTLLKFDTRHDASVLTTGLLWTIHRSHTAAASTLLSLVQPEHVIANAQRYIIAAAQAGCSDILRKMLGTLAFSHLPSIAGADGEGRTPMHFAAEMNHKDIIIDLLDHSNVDLLAQDKHGKTALHFAAESGSYEVAALLLDREPRLRSMTDVQERTALCYASMSGFNALVKLLAVQHDIDHDRPDVKGRTPLSYAMGNHHMRSAKILLSVGCSLRARDHYGMNPACWAIRLGDRWREPSERVEACTFILKHDAVALDIPDDNGWSPLFWALDPPGCAEVVEVMAETGAVDLNQRDYSGCTALHWAAGNGLTRIVEILLAHPHVDVTAVDQSGESALCKSAKAGCFLPTALLAEASPQLVSQRDKTGMIPFDWASLNQHHEVMGLLTRWATSSVESQSQS